MAENENEFNFADISKNPYIPKPDDYFEGYNQSIEKNFDPKAFEYSRLTHNVFNTNEGKEWLAQTRMLLAYRFVELQSPNPELQLAALQGSRNMLSTIDQHIEVFEQHLQGK